MARWSSQHTVLSEWTLGDFVAEPYRVGVLSRGSGGLGGDVAGALASAKNFLLGRSEQDSMLQRMTNCWQAFSRAESRDSLGSVLGDDENASTEAKDRWDHVCELMRCLDNDDGMVDSDCRRAVRNKAHAQAAFYHALLNLEIAGRMLVHAREPDLAHIEMIHDKYSAVWRSLAKSMSCTRPVPALQKHAEPVEFDAMRFRWSKTGRRIMRELEKLRRRTHRAVSAAREFADKADNVLSSFEGTAAQADARRVRAQLAAWRFLAVQRAAVADNDVSWTIAENSVDLICRYEVSPAQALHGATRGGIAHPFGRHHGHAGLLRVKHEAADLRAGKHLPEVVLHGEGLYQAMDNGELQDVRGNIRCHATVRGWKDLSVCDVSGRPARPMMAGEMARPADWWRSLCVPWGFETEHHGGADESYARRYISCWSSPKAAKMRCDMVQQDWVAQPHPEPHKVLYPSMDRSNPWNGWYVLGVEELEGHRLRIRYRHQHARVADERCVVFDRPETDDVLRIHTLIPELVAQLVPRAIIVSEYVCGSLLDVRALAPWKRTAPWRTRTHSEWRHSDRAHGDGAKYLFMDEFCKSLFTSEVDGRDYDELCARSVYPLPPFRQLGTSEPRREDVQHLLAFYIEQRRQWRLRSRSVRLRAWSVSRWARAHQRR